MSDSLEPPHARLPCPSPAPRVYPNSCSLNWWCHPTISSFVIPFSSAFNLSQHQGLFQWVSSSHQVIEVLEFQLQHQSCQWTFRTDCLSNFPYFSAGRGSPASPTPGRTSFFTLSDSSDQTKTPVPQRDNPRFLSAHLPMLSQSIEHYLVYILAVKLCL